MSSSGLKMMNFQNMTKDNKEQKLSNSTNPAIAYTPCYMQCGFIAEMLIRRTEPFCFIFV